MDEQLIKRMQVITPEEQIYLNEDPHVRKDIYTRKNKFEVDHQMFLREGKLITVRPHSRFVEFPPHKHNYIEIVYVCAGEITHYIAGKEIRMQQGDMIFLNQHVVHSVKCAEAGDIGINFIVLPEFFDIPLQMINKKNVIADFLAGTLKQSNSIPQYLNFQLQGQTAITNLMENMISSIMDKNINEDIINQYSMGLVFLYLINHIDRLSENSSHSYEDIVIQTIIKYIDSHYRTASLSEIAGDFNQSLPALSRMIKKCTGHTFQELLIRKRFQKAIMLLVETELPVDEIAWNVGYENQSYFYRQFKAYYRVTPNQYRTAHKDDMQIKI